MGESVKKERINPRDRPGQFMPMVERGKRAKSQVMEYFCCKIERILEFCQKKRISFSAENWILASGRFWLFGLRVKDERRVCVKFLKRRGAAAAEHYYTMADRG